MRELVEYDAAYRGEFGEHAAVRRLVYEDQKGVQTVELRALEPFVWQRSLAEHRYDALLAEALGTFDQPTY